MTLNAIVVFLGIAAGAIPGAIIGGLVSRNRRPKSITESDAEMVEHILRLDRQIQRLKAELSDERRR
jgi:hypothetical protein